jgi:hypothetical protein
MTLTVINYTNGSKEYNYKRVLIKHFGITSQYDDHMYSDLTYILYAEFEVYMESLNVT